MSHKLKVFLLMGLVFFMAMMPAKAHACAWWDGWCHARVAADNARRIVEEAARRVAEAAAAAARAAAEAARRAAEVAAAVARAAAEAAAAAARALQESFIYTAVRTVVQGVVNGLGGVIQLSDAVLGWNQLIDPVNNILRPLGVQVPKYYLWDEKVIPGAICGNGTPYRFYVNRSLTTTNTLFVMEGGGNCHSYGSCSYGGTAANPDGVPPNYLSLTGTVANFLNYGGIPKEATNHIYGAFYAALGGNQLMVRLHPDRVDTQDYNLIYMPYCTGDVHAGNTVRVYKSDDNSQTRVQRFVGARNAELVAQWAKDNLGKSLECQATDTFHGNIACKVGGIIRSVIGLGTDNGAMNQMVVQGSSAGGYGTLVNYPTLREKLQPARGVMLPDAALPFDVVNPNILSDADYEAKKGTSPFRIFADLITNEWGGLKEDGTGLFNKLNEIMKQASVPFDSNRLSSVIHAYGRKYPQDNMLYMYMRGDNVIPKFSRVERQSRNKYSVDYKNFNQFEHPNGNQAASDTELDKLLPMFNTAPNNVGYYMPYGWIVGDYDTGVSHTLVRISFVGTGVRTATESIPSLGPVINKTLREFQSNRVVTRALTADTSYVSLGDAVAGGLTGKLFSMFSALFKNVVPEPGKVTPAPVEQRVTFVSAVGSKCVDIYAGATADGSRLVMWDCHGGANQRWTLDENGDITSMHAPQKCMVPSDQENATAGMQVVIKSCEDTAGFKWKYDTVQRRFVHTASNLAMAVPSANITNGVGVTLAAQQNGSDGTAALTQVFCQDGVCNTAGSLQPNPNLVIKGDGQITSIAAIGDKCLDVFGWGTNDGATVGTWECHGGNNQLWKHMPNGQFINVNANKCLAVDGVGKVVVWTCQNYDNFKWTYKGGKLYSQGKVLYVEGANKNNGATIKTRVGSTAATPPLEELFVLR